MTDTPSNGKRSSFDYAATYRDMIRTHDLTTMPEEKSWRDTPPKPAADSPDGKVEQHDVVLYLGCNVLRNSHMIRNITAIFDRLELDYIAVGGPAYCCGIMQHREGDSVRSQSMGAQTIQFLQAYQPQTVVMWCPSCTYYYDDIFQLETPFTKLHATEFLAGQLDKLEFVAQPPRRVALHYHIAQPQRANEASAARALLEAVPGVEYVDIGSDEALGTICSPQLGIGPEWERRIDAQLSRAQDAGVDSFATIYHGCQRLICANEERVPFPIEHYLDIFARALGIEHEDVYKRYRLWRDPERVFADMAPCMQANNIAPDKARDVVARMFPA